MGKHSVKLCEDNVNIWSRERGKKFSIVDKQGERERECVFVCARVCACVCMFERGTERNGGLESIVMGTLFGDTTFVNSYNTLWRVRQNLDTLRTLLL